MQTKLFHTLAFLFSISIAHSQATYIPSFGRLTQEDLSLKNYPKDPDAAGVVLYERGNYTVARIDGYTKLIKEIHRKIIVFDAKKFDQATVEIPYYRWKDIEEEVTNLTAITHNGDEKKYVESQAIFDSDMGGNLSMKTFTFPDIKNGSILEYTYRIETPSLINFGTWYFMNELPTIYSELHIEIPANYRYNRSLRGNRELDINQAEVRKSCFVFSGVKDVGDCEVATYAMKDIPAYTSEAYMLSPKNFTPSLKFEIAEVIRFNKSRVVISNTWKDLDKQFQTGNEIGGQLNLSKYFRKFIPKSILSIPDDLERAKAVYYFIQSKFLWNKKSGFTIYADVKDAFKNGTGNSSEINFILVNALEAAGLDAKAMAIATRQQPLPTKLYPVLTDFNYVIVFLKINNQNHFLDATEKHSQFGVLPIRALNLQGRVLDLKKGSYWEPIVSFKRNMHYTTIRLEANPQGTFSGNITEMSTGQIALDKRQKNNLLSDQEIEKRKQSVNENVDISEYRIENKSELEQAYTESYNITFQEHRNQDRYFLYPFLMENYFSENPFTQKERQYPIDMGFPVINNYLVSLDVKDQYDIVKVPSNQILQLPENDGELSVVYETMGSKINIRLNLKLNTTSYSPDAYKSLSEFFDLLMKIQSQEPIELRRI